MALEVTSHPLVGSPDPQNEAGRQLRAAVLSSDAAAVLQAASDEQSSYGEGAPLDTADLLIGLLQVPSTHRLLEGRGITVERVRRAKRDADGYLLAQRLQGVAPQWLSKSRQVSRIARLLGEWVVASNRSTVEPEDILAVMLLDGLGWGTSILDQLGVNSRQLGAGLARPALLAAQG